VQPVAAVAAVTPVAGQSAVNAVSDGAVTITDLSASLTDTGAITAITLANSGANSAINDNVLLTLNLSGTVGSLTINSNTANQNHSLALTLNGLTAANNGIDDTNNEIATLNVTTTGADSVLADFNDSTLTTLNLSGSKKLTLQSIPGNLSTLTISGSASFSDGATVHGTGLSVVGSILTITDSSTGSFTAVLDDTDQSFTGSSGTDIITVSATDDANNTLTAGSAGNNELILEGGPYALTSSSSGKFVNFQILGVAANVSGTIDLSVIDANASGLEVMGANSITFNKVAKGASLLLDPSNGATVTVNYADSSGASDSCTVTMSSAIASLTLQDSKAAGIGTLTFVNSLASSETNVSSPHVIAVLPDTGLSNLNVSGNAGLTINTLNEASNTSTTFSINNSSSNFYGLTIGTLVETAMTTKCFSQGGIHPSFNEVGGIRTSRKIKIGEKVRERLVHDRSHASYLFVNIVTPLVFLVEYLFESLFPDLVEHEPSLFVCMSLHVFQLVHELQNFDSCFLPWVP
jgi:hypothetical protein